MYFNAIQVSGTNSVIFHWFYWYKIFWFFFCRRDRGVTSPNVMITFETNSLKQNHTASAIIGETIFVFVVPSLLHFCGFISAVYFLRIADNEQLQNLVERVSWILNRFSTSVTHVNCSGFHIMSISQSTVLNALVLHFLRNHLDNFNGIMHRIRRSSFIRHWR